jgi:hypothetical protein
MGIDTISAGVDRVRKFVDRGSRDLRLLSIASFVAMFGYGAFSAAYNNFIVDVLKLRPGQLGIVESFRESPGFLMFAVAALTMRIAEPPLAAASLLMVAIGLVAYCGVHGLPSLVVWSVVWSMGLHAWMTLQPSMTLSLSTSRNKGLRLGQITAVSALGTILGMVLVLIGGNRLGFNRIFIVSCAFVLVGAAALLGISKDIGQAEKPRLVFKREYSLYYLLTFLEGCRKQVFLTFAIFLLVRNYHTPIHIVALLMILNNVVNLSMSAWIGRMIDRFGERLVLIVCYTAAIPVFIGYAMVHNALMLYILYGLDNLFYIGSMGSTTYLHRIADPKDVMPSLAMGVSMNHAAAVAVPLIGGLLWATYGHAVTFYGGAVVVAISVFAVFRMRSVAVPVGLTS